MMVANLFFYWARTAPVRYRLAHVMRQEVSAAFPIYPQFHLFTRMTLPLNGQPIHLHCVTVKNRAMSI